MNWLVQRRNDGTVYALVIGKLKNGAMKVIAIDDDRKVAANRSTSGWFPAPSSIDEAEVPEKLKAKVLKKAGL